MPLQVMQHSGNSVERVVVVESADPGELDLPAVEQLAVETGAQAGMFRPGVSRKSAPYPVDSEGQTSDDLFLGKVGGVVAWRCDVTVLAMPA